MTAKGIPCFMDKLGREWSPEAYINMDIRTTCGNVAHQMQFDRMDDYDTTLLEVSSHNGARPKCAKDQGRIFDRKNKSKKYRHWKTSSYGEPDGILGINCGHHIYPFIEGVNTQTYFPYDEKENAEAYKQSQQQRQLERNVRAKKRECVALDTLGDKEGFKKASVKLKRETDKLKQFCKDTGRMYKGDRVYTPNFNRSVSGKVNGANKLEIIDKAKENDIIEVAKKLNIKGKVKYKPKAIDVRDFTFDDNHINSERKHKVTLDQAISYMDNAKYSLTKWNFQYINFYSDNGAVFIDTKNKNIRTAFTSDEFDDQTKELMKEVHKK